MGKGVSANSSLLKCSLVVILPYPDIQKYNMRYKIDKASGTWFDPPDFLWRIKFIRC